MKIGVFDSGVGGMSVVNAITKSLPEVEVVYASDTEHMPYGDKPPAEVLKLTVPVLKRLADEGCAIIVIACNTVTTHHITALRKLVSVPLVGIEPMIKPAAALTKTGTIAVCATPATLASERYAWLKKTYAEGLRVIEPDCSRWAYMIEHNRTNDLRIGGQITDICDQGADVIVLGCTHYHWIEKEVLRLSSGRAAVIQPEQAVIKQLRRVMQAVQRSA